jgi:ABC-type transport system involved in multi-copper enzyme maturation permease subunit
MRNILLVARNAFRGILFARSLYLWIIAILLVGIQLAPQIIFRNTLPNFMARAPQRPLPAGLSAEEQKKIQDLETKQRELQFKQIQDQFRRQRPRAIANGLNLWSMLSIGFAILLGANVLANEVALKTIITVLARPISRWELLLGKWAAIQAFGAMSLLFGLGIHFAAASYLDIHINSTIWLGLLNAMVSIMLYSGIAIALGTVVGWAVSAGLTLVVAFIPGLVTFLKGNDTRFWHLLGATLDWIVPSGFLNIFVNSVDASVALDRSLQYKTLELNILYCAIYFILGCIMFTRREVRLG